MTVIVLLVIITALITRVSDAKETHRLPGPQALPFFGTRWLFWSRYRMNKLHEAYEGNSNHLSFLLYVTQVLILRYLRYYAEHSKRFWGSSISFLIKISSVTIVVVTCHSHERFSHRHVQALREGIRGDHAEWSHCGLDSRPRRFGSCAQSAVQEAVPTAYWDRAGLQTEQAW